MRVLFISKRLLNKGSGAEQVARRNLQSLRVILGYENVDTISFDNNINNIKRIDNEKMTILPENGSFIKGILNEAFRFNLEGLTNENINYILNIVPDYDMVFLDSSSYGKLANKIKKLYGNIKVTVFFHDINKYLMKSLILAKGNIKYRLLYLLTYISYVYNEKLSVLNLDKSIVLNSRDLKLIKSIYGLSADSKIPITLKDNFSIEQMKYNLNIKKDEILFVGAYYLPNVEGILWFIDNVFPYVKNKKLVIVGKGMEALKDKVNNENIEIYGYVDDLATFYYNAEFVIAPIFTGGGMKVKTAEALMYGKTVIGTSESFEGYDISTNKIGYVCDTSKDFINVINNKKIEKYNINSRNEFLKKYSNESALNKFKKVII